MPYFSHAGARLHFTHEGAGPALLFLHGYSATTRLWDAQAAAFAGDFTILRLDQAGHGRSEARALHTLESLAADAVALLDTLMVERAIVIGHSMGGMVALEMMASHPERLAAAVLTATSCFAPPRAAFEKTVAFALGLGSIPQATRDADPVLRTLAPLAPETARDFGEMMMNLPPLLDRVRGFDRPVAILHGSAESDGIRQGSAALCDALPHADLAVIDGAGHVPPVTHAAVYNALLADFLERNRDG
jgi:pimeloyl-ACP methyl ester carboxylesterase